MSTFAGANKFFPLREISRKTGSIPLELFALLPDGDNAYLAAEGNRRLCAALVHESELARNEPDSFFHSRGPTLRIL